MQSQSIARIARGDNSTGRPSSGHPCASPGSHYYSGIADAFLYSAGGTTAHARTDVDWGQQQCAYLPTGLISPPSQAAPKLPAGNRAPSPINGNATGRTRQNEPLVGNMAKRDPQMPSSTISLSFPSSFLL